MIITVRLFASSRELARTDQIKVELPEQSTLAQLSEAIGQTHPELAPIVKVSRIAVNQNFANLDVTIAASDEIALIPPVSGG